MESSERSQSTAAAVCCVCYEDLKPGVDRLQAVVGCGHVLHELCFQQWLEYSPKRTCPVCKRPCTNVEVHRLFFSTSGVEATQPKCTSVSSQDVQELQSRVSELQARLSDARSKLQSCSKQLKERDEQAEHYKVRLKESECNRENCMRRLYELEEKYSNLLEKNTELSNEAKSYELLMKCELTEDDVIKLTGRNNQKTIDILAKSLVLRNKTYKDLLNKYSELDASEKNAIRRCEKAAEQLKRAKTRLQELEKALELKENKDLRSLKQRSEQIDVKDLTCEAFSGAHSAATLRIEVSQSKGAVATSNHQSVPSATTVLPKPVSSSLPLPVRREAPAREGAAPPDSGCVADRHPGEKKRVYSAVQSASRLQFAPWSSKGHFILSGADGRGGRVKVLKPLQVSGGVNSVSQVKRCKSTPSVRSAGLQIDHFFGRLEPQ